MTAAARLPVARRELAAIEPLIAQLRNKYADRITGELEIPPKPARYADFPDTLDPIIKATHMLVDELHPQETADGAQRPMHEELATAAGEALAEVNDVGVADAIVMASAARRGDVVYTSDFEDLQRLRAVFPTVRVLSV